MNPLSIIGLFCEDIRVESGDVLTLVGLIPDNINMQRLPTPEKGKGPIALGEGKVISNLCVYARANFEPNDPVNEITLNLVFPDERRMPLGGASADVIQRSKLQAKEKGNPLAGVIMRAQMQGFSLPGPGMVRLEAVIDSEVRLLAALNFKLAEKTTSSSEPAPPSLQ